MLNLRSIYTTGSGSDSDNTISTVKSVSFANAIVGNLGAPLRDSIYGSSNHDEDEGEIYVTSDPLLAGLAIENMDEYPDFENVSVIDHVQLCRDLGSNLAIYPPVLQVTNSDAMECLAIRNGLNPRHRPWLTLIALKRLSIHKNVYIGQHTIIRTGPEKPPS